MADLLEFRNVTKIYSRGVIGKQSTTALNNVSLVLKENEPTIMTVAWRKRQREDHAGYAAARLYRANIR